MTIFTKNQTELELLFLWRKKKTIIALLHWKQLTITDPKVAPQQKNLKLKPPPPASAASAPPFPPDRGDRKIKVGLKLWLGPFILGSKKIYDQAFFKLWAHMWLSWEKDSKVISCNNRYLKAAVIPKFCPPFDPRPPPESRSPPAGKAPSSFLRRWVFISLPPLKLHQFFFLLFWYFPLSVWGINRSNPMFNFRAFSALSQSFP